MLSALEGHEESIKLLQDIYDEMPLIHWSDKSIRDTVEQFIADNGRAPTVSDFRKKGMPPHTVIKQKYNITLGEWLNENYPTPKPSFQERKDQYTRTFIDEYIRIKPASAKDYDKRRSSAAKSWISVAKYHNVGSWHNLLKLLSLPSHSRLKKTKKRVEFNVSVHTDCDFLE